MSGEFDDPVAEDRAETHETTPPPKRFGKSIGRFFGKITDAIGDFLSSHKKGIFITLIGLLVILSGVYLPKDYLTKRQNYPERNVLFRATNSVYIAGGTEKKGTASVDQFSETEVYEGA